MSSTSSINTVSGNKNYISGLASGMDTDSIVESLLMGTQSKIDKQTGLKQQLEWKQDIYRDYIGKINTFGDKYFSYYGSGSTNLMSPTTFKTMTGLSSNSAIKISSVSSNAVSSMKVQSVDQLATACTVKTAGTVTGVPVGKTADFSQFALSVGETKSFNVTLDGVNRTIDFVVEGVKGADAATPGTVDVEKTLDNINEALYRNFGTSVGMAFQADSTGSMKGTMKLVQLNADGSESDVAVNSSRRVIIETTGDSDSSNTIANLGFKGGFSNKLDYGTSLRNMNFATPLQGDRYEFKINGVTVKGLTGDSTLSDVISAINNSGAGVKVSYSSASDKFIMESSSTGDISNIKMEQTYGNLLTTMFGVESTGFQSSLLSKDIVSDAPVNMDAFINDLNSGKNKSLILQVEGKDFTVNLEGKTGSEKYKDAQSVIDAINSKLNKEYGYDKIKFSLKADAVSGENHMVIGSSEYDVSFNPSDSNAEAAAAMGFADADVKSNVHGSKPMAADVNLLGQIKINNNVVIDFANRTDADGTIDLARVAADLEAAVTDAAGGTGASVKYENGRFNITGVTAPLTIEGVAVGGGTNPVTELFGSDKIEFKAGTFDPVTQVTAGQNAKLTVDNVQIERNTNTFELDGITMELTSTYAASNGPISLTTSRDTDKIVEGLKSFVEDYNTLIEELNKELKETANYKKYPPLTDAQKKEMSDKEIELWEEKSKQGLLHNDSNISSFLGEMRMALYSSVEGAGLSLYDIGIETSDSWRDNGKLVIDEDALKSAVATNADAIGTLFTDREQGLGVKLQNAIKAAANVSSGSPGSMVRYAGTKDVLATSNTLYEEMKDIAETLSNLNTKYQLEKTRYWKQFTAMEQAISNMNSQSSWLTQQFSS